MNHAANFLLPAQRYQKRDITGEMIYMRRDAFRVQTVRLVDIREETSVRRVPESFRLHLPPVLRIAVFSRAVFHGSRNRENTIGRDYRQARLSHVFFTVWSSGKSIFFSLSILHTVRDDHGLQRVGVDR